MNSIRSTSNLRGVTPILVTPFDEKDQVDVAALEAEAQFLAEVGIASVGIGYGSEVQLLTTSEMSEIYAVAARSQLSVVGNVEFTGMQTARESLESLARQNVNYAMVRPVPIPGLAQDDYLGYLSILISESPLPVVFQDAVQHTGIDITPAALARLLRDLNNLVAVKVEPPGAATKMSEILASSETPCLLIGGAQGVGYLQELERGSQGTMPGPAFPELFLALGVLQSEARRDQAFRMLSAWLPLMTLSSRNIETFIAVQKYLLVRRGVLRSTKLRSPHRPIDDSLFTEVEEVLGVFDLDERIQECTEVIG